MMRPLVSAICFLLLFAFSAAASDFRMIECKVTGKIGTVVAKDLNNDGRNDLVVSYVVGSPPNHKSKIAVFISDNSGPKEAPDFVMDLPGDACLFDLADFDQDKQLELVLLRKWSIYSYALTGERKGASEKILSKGSDLLFPPEDGLVPYLDLAQDWNGDQLQELAVLQYGFAQIYQYVEGQPMKKNRLRSHGSSWLDGD